MAVLCLDLGFKCFSLFCQVAKIDTEQEDLHPDLIADSAALIEDEESEKEVNPEFHVNAPKATTSFDLDGPNPQAPDCPHITEDEEDRQVNVSAEFLKCHHKFNHCSPRCMQLLACRGVNQRRLAKCPVPVCSACLCSKATGHPWCTKPGNDPSCGCVPTRS